MTCARKYVNPIFGYIFIEGFENIYQFYDDIVPVTDMTFFVVTINFNVKSLLPVIC